MVLIVVGFRVLYEMRAFGHYEFNGQEWHVGYGLGRVGNRLDDLNRSRWHKRNTAKQSVDVVGNKSTMVPEPCGRLSNPEASERTRWALHVQIFTSAVGKASVIFILSFLFSFFSSPNLRCINNVVIEKCGIFGSSL